MIELKPCPFCGATEGFGYHMDQGDKWGRVICGCGATGPEVRTGYRQHNDPKEPWGPDAAEEWHRRK